MILDQLMSRAAGRIVAIDERPLTAQLPAGRSGAGRRPLVSLSLPFGRGDADAADAEGFAPNAFIRIEGDGQMC